MRVPVTASGVNGCLGVSPEVLAMGKSGLGKGRWANQNNKKKKKKGTLRDAKRGAIGGRVPIGRSTCPKGRL